MTTSSITENDGLFFSGNPVKKALRYTCYTAVASAYIVAKEAPMFVGAYKGFKDALGSDIAIPHLALGTVAVATATRSVGRNAVDDKGLVRNVGSSIATSALEFGIGWAVCYYGTLAAKKIFF